MTAPFQPHKPEKMTTIAVSIREAKMLIKLREYPYGKFTIHKAENLIVRLEVLESMLIKEEDGEEKSNSR